MKKIFEFINEEYCSEVRKDMIINTNSPFIEVGDLDQTLSESNTRFYFFKIYFSYLGEEIKNAVDDDYTVIYFEDKDYFEISKYHTVYDWHKFLSYYRLQHMNIAIARPSWIDEPWAKSVKKTINHVNNFAIVDKKGEVLVDATKQYWKTKYKNNNISVAAKNEILRSDDYEWLTEIKKKIVYDMMID